MRIIWPLIGAFVLTTSGCKEDISAPAIARNEIVTRPVPKPAKFNVSEENLFRELTTDMSTEKAARIRAKLLENGVVVFGKTEHEQQLISAIYKSMDSRSASANGAKPSGPPPRTAKNSWAPKSDDWILINSLLNRLPTESRSVIKENLLRTDVWLSKKDDPELQRLLDLIYERRTQRLKEARVVWK